MNVKVKKIIDNNYIFAHCNQNVYEIPYYYDIHKWNIGETYRIRVGHIYDPSKFWIVVKEKELNILQAFLTYFYKKHGDLYKMNINTVCKNIYCVVYIDNDYYRGLIINVPHSLSTEKMCVVFLFDFGYIATVGIEHLYYLYEKLYEIPRFAVRASLSRVQPYDKFTWTYNVIKRFSELVSGKILLCILKCTDPNRRIVEIDIGALNEFSVVTDIGNILIHEKFALSIAVKKKLIDSERMSRYIPKTKYPYLFPSFESIESGMVPSSVYISNIVTQCVSSDHLYKPYYAYNCI